MPNHEHDHHDGHGHHHHGNEKRFPFHKMDRLDSPERQSRQPAAGLVALVAEHGPKRVLDIGVGTGYFALPLLEMLPEAKVTGLDVEPRMLGVFVGRAMERGFFPRVGTVEVPPDDAEHLPELDEPQDAILMVNLLHELDDREAYLAGVRRALADGGRFVLCDWDPGGDPEQGPPREIRVPVDVAKKELTNAGFTKITRTDLYPSFYTLVCE